MVPAFCSLWLHGIVGSTFVYGCHELGHGTVRSTLAIDPSYDAITTNDLHVL